MDQVTNAKTQIRLEQWRKIMIVKAAECLFTNGASKTA